MEDTSENKEEQGSRRVFRHVSMALLAHVDAGKTTLSESMLYEAGSIRRMGRVDNGDSFLDTHALERERGITIFSRQAVFSLGDLTVTLLDTPGHVDFSAEMERTLQVLDYGILVISGADGLKGHTKTLWRLLGEYRIPTFLFINKMDQRGTDREKLLKELRESFGDGCIDFNAPKDAAFYENVALCSEKALEEFLATGSVKEERLKELIRERKLFPCFFGSALKAEGVKEFMEALGRLAVPKTYPEEFGARVYKVSRDSQGNRLTHMKVTGGILKVKAAVGTDKVNQIRIYSGDRYEAVQEALAGSVCAVTGLSRTRPGQGLGIEKEGPPPSLTPVLAYRMKLPEGCDPAQLFPKLQDLSEEDPTLHLSWEESAKEIRVSLMGEVQTEVLKRLIKDRLDVSVEFDAGSIVYRETVTDRVEGVGHYEPLRHYAEVHLLLEPGERGSGLAFESACPEDQLSGNWQRLILTHLSEKEHKGVLTGSALTDMKITLAAGKAHQKHTEGGDFRQATYRALRQGLKEAQSLLLEPFYEFVLEVPQQSVGRAMADMERMCGVFEAPEIQGKMAVLTGIVPASTVRGYQKEVLSYTGGQGRLFYSFRGYEPCHNAEEVIESMAYDSERDLENPTGSVFCAHGAGFLVDWAHVKEYMHVESALPAVRVLTAEQPEKGKKEEPSASSGDYFLGTEEVDAIIERTYGANRKKTSFPGRNRPKTESARTAAPQTNETLRETTQATVTPRETTQADESLREVFHASEILRETTHLCELFLVDGYNMIFSWEELKELSKVTMDGARERLKELLCNYQAVRGCELILVFDAYRVQGHDTEYTDYHNIHVVYTKEAETADQYIEKFAHENGKKYRITVATSDGLEQIIIRGQGCLLMSARELEEDVRRTGRTVHEEYARKQPAGKVYLAEAFSEKKKQEADAGNVEKETEAGSVKEMKFY